jgi:hypothetical protein
MRAIALLVLFAVMPTAELTEQVVHLVEHVLHADAPDHSAHHDESQQGDEHGCTGLVHLCGCHHTQVTAGIAIVASRSIEIAEALTIDAPASLADLTSLEPAHRPPIA